ncbi:TPA: ANR family transcriptional regulator [Vibrio parahaemolyticus]|nr:ANR family transcriptional regulator [Vibrio parahaemolyticus]HAV1327685.1 ANR family transcriptional regulator [Vibrio parahaemolyticus]HBN6271647.1 ANR family transcriptional regulator [Vibrio parahaemolyticus]
MKSKTYVELAKHAGQAEREGRWQDAYQFWSLAQQKASGNHTDNAWAERRALFCQHRIPKPNPLVAKLKTYFFNKSYRHDQ